MIKIGYYRYKTIVNGDSSIEFLKNYTVASTKYIKAVNECTGFILLKYLDKNGQYRFFPFSNMHRVYDNPEQIGTANKMIISILTDKTNSQNVGYKNERKIDITGEVNEDQLLKLQDIYTSPRVYYYIGSNNSDTDADWIEIKIIANENIIKRRRANSGRVDITITLPENFNITML